MVHKMRKIEGPADDGSRKLRRYPRVRLKEGVAPYLRLTDPISSPKLQLNDISAGGVGILRTTEVDWPAPGTRMKGLFGLGGEEIPVDLKVIGIYSKVIGCEFAGDFRPIRKKITEHFDFEISAAGMREINPDVLKQPEDENLKLRYFSSESHGELSLFLDQEDDLQRFELGFLGNWFEGSKNEPVRYGTTSGESPDPAAERSGQFVYKGSELVRWENMDPKIRTVALQFVEKMDEVPKELRAHLTNWLKT